MLAIAAVAHVALLAINREIAEPIAALAAWPMPPPVKQTRRLEASHLQRRLLI